MSLPTRGVPRSGSGSPSLLLSNFGIMLRGASAPPECKNIHPDPPGFLQHLLCANASPKHLELISLRGKTPAFFFPKTRSTHASNIPRSLRRFHTDRVSLPCARRSRRPSHCRAVCWGPSRPPGRPGRAVTVTGASVSRVWHSGSLRTARQGPLGHSCTLLQMNLARFAPLGRLLGR